MTDPGTDVWVTLAAGGPSPELATAISAWSALGDTCDTINNNTTIATDSAAPTPMPIQSIEPPPAPDTLAGSTARGRAGPWRCLAGDSGECEGSGADKGSCAGHDAASGGEIGGGAGGLAGERRRTPNSCRHFGQRSTVPSPHAALTANVV